MNDSLKLMATDFLDAVQRNDTHAIVRTEHDLIQAMVHNTESALIINDKVIALVAVAGHEVFLGVWDAFPL